MRLRKQDQQMLAEAYEQVGQEGDKAQELLRFAKYITNYSSQMPQYKSLLNHIDSLDRIKGPQHEDGLLTALIQVAQDPFSNKKSDMGYSVNSIITQWFEENYPERLADLKRPIKSGALGGAGVVKN